MLKAVYNRKARTYDIQDPDGLVVEGGVKGKDAANEVIVRLMSPMLYGLVMTFAASYSTIKVRAIKAAILVLEGRVNLIANDFAYVAGSKSSPYRVWNDGTHWRCECDDFVRANAIQCDGDSQRRCKHVVATEYAIMSNSWAGNWLKKVAPAVTLA